LTFKGRHGGHDDFAMLVLLAALVDIEGGLGGSPLFEPQRQARERQDLQTLAGLALHGGPAFSLDAVDAIDELIGYQVGPKKKQAMLEMMERGASVGDAALGGRYHMAVAEQRRRNANVRAGVPAGGLSAREWRLWQNKLDGK